MRRLPFTVLSRLLTRAQVRNERRPTATNTAILLRVRREYAERARRKGPEIGISGRVGATLPGA